MTIAYNRHEELEKRRALRQRSPEMERVLWQMLRGRRLNNLKFRRQYSVGPYVLDFYCPILKLALEIDGFSHDGPDAQEYDAERQRYIEAHGIRFLRFPNASVHTDPKSVLAAIASYTEAQCNILPSP